MYSTPVLLMLLVFLAISKGQDDGGTCEVIPKDPYIELGSDIQIVLRNTCSGGGHLHSHNKIYWTLNNQRVDESLYEVINSSFSAVALGNFSLHRATVQCHSLVFEQVLGGTIIKTYQRPSNISCVWSTSQSGYTCHWEHKMNDSSLKVNYTVYRKWEKVNGGGNWESDTCTSRTRSCTFPDPPIESRIQHITVRATTTAWEVDSVTQPLDPWQTHGHLIRNTGDHAFTVKIDNPKWVKVVPLSNRLRVEWSRPEGEAYTGLLINCQVKYAQHVVNTAMNEDAMLGSLATGEVEPCTNHTVSVRCALDRAPWSNWTREKTALSSLNVSSIPLNLWRKIEVSDITGRRRVHLMWEGISPSCKAVDGYRVRVMAVNNPIPVRHFNTTRDNTNVTLDKEAHRITLAAYSHDIMFPEHSTYVPAVGETLPQVRQVHTLAHDGIIQVSWAAPAPAPGLPPVPAPTPGSALTSGPALTPGPGPDQPIHSYMVDWTTDGTTYTWTQTPDTHISLTGLQPFKQYTITITPLSNEKTGQEHITHICSKERAPGHISSVHVEAQDRSAWVNWTAVPQTHCSGAVVNYTVFYQTEPEPEMNVTVNSRKLVILEHLQPGRKYRVHVMATAVTGATNSSITVFTTNRYNRTFILLLGVFGGLSIFIILFTGLFCVIQWRRFMEKMVPDPGFSSLAHWSSQTGHMTQPFNHPPQRESFCEWVPWEVDAMMGDITPTTTEDQEPISDQDENQEPINDEGEEPIPNFCSWTSCECDPRKESVDSGVGPGNPPGLGHPEERQAPPEEMTISESSVIQTFENCPINPYKNQSPVELPVGFGLGRSQLTQGVKEESERLLETKQLSKTTPTPLTAYVTVDMLEQRQGR